MPVPTAVACKDASVSNLPLELDEEFYGLFNNEPPSFPDVSLPFNKLPNYCNI